jgi:hypothetical protein
MAKKLRIYAEITSGAKYPITTKTRFDATTWPAAAKLAMAAHRNALRESKKLRQQGEDIRIKLLRMPDAAEEAAPPEE